MLKRLLCLCVLCLGALTASADTPKKFAALAAARVEKGYVAVQYANGKRGMFPFSGLSDDERAWLEQFATEHPLAKGRGSVVVAKTEQVKTIETQTVREDGTEVVQLRRPAKLRDQIGGTCMFYARVHYLDIAGYPVEDAEIYRTINNCPTDAPFIDIRYWVGLMMLFLHQNPSPIAHFPDGRIHPFDWARAELRKGHPILARLPQDIWMKLPAEQVARFRWDGTGKIGHQIVINGFTYNPKTKEGTFHVINSWDALPEFDITADTSRGVEHLIGIEQSLSAKGEPPEESAKLTVSKITELNQVGKNFLYLADTNLGPRKVVAPTEQAAREFIESQDKDKDMRTDFGDFFMRLVDYVEENIDPKFKEAAISLLLTEFIHVPTSTDLPHVDLEAKTSQGTIYFVRVETNRVVRINAESIGDALEKARKLPTKG
jgi:hypothetical protein